MPRRAENQSEQRTGENNSRMKVIVIDNDTALLRSLQVLLESRGHEVVCLADAAAAEEAVERTLPDVVLLDLVLPGAWGPDVIRRIRSRSGCSCRVILMSGHTDLVGRLDLEQEGVVVFLPKPIDYVTLTGLIEGREKRAP